MYGMVKYRVLLQWLNSVWYAQIFHRAYIINSFIDFQKLQTGMPYSATRSIQRTCSTWKHIRIWLWRQFLVLHCQLFHWTVFLRREVLVLLNANWFVLAIIDSETYGPSLWKWQWSKWISVRNYHSNTFNVALNEQIHQKLRWWVSWRGEWG